MELSKFCMTLGLIFLSAQIVLADSPVQKDDLPGVVVARLAVEGPYYVAEIRIEADGTYRFRDANMDRPMPEPGCSGKWTFKKAKFLGTLDCSAVGGQNKIKQEINLSGVTSDALKESGTSKEGVSVLVKSSILGEQPLPFKLFKTDKPFF